MVSSCDETETLARVRVRIDKSVQRSISHHEALLIKMSWRQSEAITNTLSNRQRTIKNQNLSFPYFTHIAVTNITEEMLAVQAVYHRNFPNAVLTLFRRGVTGFPSTNGEISVGIVLLLIYNTSLITCVLLGHVCRQTFLGFTCTLLSVTEVTRI